MPRGIAISDLAGVSLAAVQGLNAKLEQKMTGGRAQATILSEQVADLESRFENIEGEQRENLKVMEEKIFALAQRLRH